MIREKMDDDRVINEFLIKGKASATIGRRKNELFIEMFIRSITNFNSKFCFIINS
jgi:hypothetical protein